jgi:hypothetical protein
MLTDIINGLLHSLEFDGARWLNAEAHVFNIEVLGSKLVANNGYRNYGTVFYLDNCRRISSIYNMALICQ